MNINQNRNADCLTVSIEGRLDTITAPELEQQLDEMIRNTKTLILDMKALEYISSAGLRVILKAQKMMMMQGEMKIVGANESIMEVFEITGFSDILTIE